MYIPLRVSIHLDGSLSPDDHGHSLCKHTDSARDRQTDRQTHSHTRARARAKERRGKKEETGRKEESLIRMATVCGVRGRN